MLTKITGDSTGSLIDRQSGGAEQEPPLAGVSRRRHTVFFKVTAQIFCPATDSSMPSLCAVSAGKAFDEPCVLVLKRLDLLRGRYNFLLGR